MTCDPLIKSWAFMDDRTIGILQQGSRELLRRGLQFAQNFDRKVGFEINPDKTLIYYHGSRDLTTMEHLGLKHNLADPHGPILPRDAVKRDDVVDRLFTCPGTIQVRSKLATAFVRPLADWASPFMSPGSQDQVKSLFRAITHATTKWWCYGRFWCQHVENHPCFRCGHPWPLQRPWPPFLCQPPALGGPRSSCQRVMPSRCSHHSPVFVGQNHPPSRLSWHPANGWACYL